MPHDLIFSFNARPFVGPNHERLVVNIAVNDTPLKILDYVYGINDDFSTVNIDIPRDVIDERSLYTHKL